MTVTSGPVILLGGPTASGKSGLAMRLARAVSGILINADSMQVYADLRVLTARPSPQDEAALPHRLYGAIDAAERCSVGLWHGLAHDAADQAVQVGRVPILVGGTGLYLEAFRKGLSPIPETPPDLRQRLSVRLAAEGSEVLHAELVACDPDLAAQLPPGDSQRIQRALEVLELTGVPLSEWRKRPRTGAWPGPLLYLVVAPARDALYRSCESRFDAMLAAGALDEVRQLTARGLDSSLPAMRALGVPHLMAHLDGHLSLEEAAERAKTGTRRYAKRQSTWFRHQAAEALRIEGFGHDKAAESAVESAAQFLLTAQGTPA
ncbi:MAG: tRNA (adenosine(37)-N6)-dimethylallyltransferase MiaA [Rhodospirillales bacterium]|nr:tRNA (adenosine(37)-N6)-dimethylallyltransferase MiaA [Rhodospirillales bacterium]